MISTVGKLPTIDDSFCRSLCSPRPLRREVLADDRHREVRAALPAELLREREAQPAGASARRRISREQLLPLLARHAAVLEVGARVLAAMVEEADVVVLLFERLDLALDEVVELVEEVLDVVRGCRSPCLSLRSGPKEGLGCHR